MKRLNASVMAVAVVLALIAVVAPSSAYSISGGSVSECVSGETKWTFTVTCDPYPWDEHDISHFTVAWCNKNAVLEVLVDGVPLLESKWDYGDFDEGITGIKIDYDVFKGHTVEVEIRLNGCYGIPSDNVAWVTKANGDYATGTVRGPLACTPIPEFSTIAIPIASILGLLFFFNHRKRREE